MKNKILTIFFAMIVPMIVLMIAAVPVNAALSSFPQVTVTLINQEPDPVSPGSIVNVKFRIENEGSDPANNMQVKLVTDFPFSLYGDEEIKDIGTLAGSQTGDIGVRKDWNVFVDQSAVTGSSSVDLLYKFDNGVWTKAGSYDISIKSTDAVLAIREVKVDQDSIVPGTKAKVSFVLENMADNTLKDIKLNLALYTELTTAASITFRELPFTPINSGNEKSLNQLRSGDSEEIEFTLFTDADADSKVYKVPYTLTYYDASGTSFSRSGIVGLIVESKPELSINIDYTDIYEAGKKGTVEIKFVNKGFSDIKFLDIILTETEEFDILSNHEVYIGKIDSDDYETAEYTIMTNKDASEKTKLPLKVEYRDANGKLYSQNIDLILDLYSGNDLKERQNGEKTSPVGIIIVVVLVAGVGYYFFRKIRKNKKK